ncbi:MAG: hypothetical protein KDB14_21690 [Planctomycetales bacterium]|nr:hypothetical protein [Planctomycetales bacterium]
MEPMWDKAAWKVIVDQSDVIEFDWYACDCLGHVAAFSSFGRGPIPMAAKSSRDSYNELFELIAALPETTEADLVHDGDGRFDDWIKYSCQGLFGYDLQDAHRATPLGQYDLLTCPRHPIHIDSLSLSPSLRRIVPRMDIEFGAHPAVPFRAIPL